MRLEQPVSVPAKTYDSIWIARVGTVLPLPEKGIAIDPNTNEQVAVTQKKDATIQFTLLPYNKLSDGNMDICGTPINKTVKMSQLLAQPDVAEAIEVIAKALLSLQPSI